MPHREWKFRIQDILDAINAIQKYTQGMEFNFPKSYYNGNWMMKTIDVRLILSFDRPIFPVILSMYLQHE